ncbi:MAG: glycosyl hydrolase [Chitinispirillaceae bacterium]
MKSRCRKETVTVSIIMTLVAFGVLWADGYRTDIPSNIQLPGDPYITENIQGPVLTTDWCASAAFDSTSNNMFAHPLAFKCETDGVFAGYPNRAHVGENFYSFPFHKDLKVSSSGLTDQHALLDSYGDWNATVAWGEDFKATMGHGMPYAYFTSSSGIKIECSETPVIWHTEDEIAGLTIGDRHYGLFAPAGSQWVVNGTTLTSTLNGQNYFSLAALPDNQLSTIAYYRRFAYNFITDTRVSWKYNRTQSTVTSTYSTFFESKEGNETDILYALYPHQWHYCSASFTDYSYNSVRGQMKVLQGPSFTTETPFTGILPHLPLMAENSEEFDMATLKQFIDQEQGKTADQLVAADGDTYWTGKALGRTAQLVGIAEQVGDTEAQHYFLSVLKTKLEGWLTYTADEPAEYFVYEPTWGTLVGVNPSFGSDASINDHHFHYGYYIMAAAIVAQYDRPWADEWEQMVEMLIRDCNTPFRDDEMFPFMRAFDIYAGHSWASGDAAFASGNNQESTSEAVNFAAGTALWGMATQDSVMRDLGIFLYATETVSLGKYWLDTQNEIFPDDFNHTMVGMVWGEKADYATWFSGEPECIHGINMLPVTAASLYLGADQNYVLDNYSEIVSNNNGAVDDWLDIMWQFLALGDPEAALHELNSNPGYAPEAGESRAHTYHWIHNLNAAGKIAAAISADIPSYAVFEKSGRKTYVMYNEKDTEAEVTFSDGVRFTVSPKTLQYADDSLATPVKRSVTSEKFGKSVELSYRQGKPFVRVNKNDSYLVTLYDLSGRTIARKRVHDGGYHNLLSVLGVENLGKSGMRFLSIENDDGRCHIPFISAQ